MPNPYRDPLRFNSFTSFEAKPSKPQSHWRTWTVAGMVSLPLFCLFLKLLYLGWVEDMVYWWASLGVAIILAALGVVAQLFTE